MRTFASLLIASCLLWSSWMPAQVMQVGVSSMGVSGPGPIALINHGATGNGGGSSTVAATMTVGSTSDLITVWVSWCGNSSGCLDGTVFTETAAGTKGETYVACPSPFPAQFLAANGQYSNMHCFYSSVKPSSTGSDTITVTFSGNSFYATINTAEWSNASTIDTGTPNRATGNSAPSSVTTAAATAVANEMILAFTGNLTPDATYTAVDNSEYKIGATTASYTCTPTGAGGGWLIGILSIKP